MVQGRIEFTFPCMGGCQHFQGGFLTPHSKFQAQKNGVLLLGPGIILILHLKRPVSNPHLNEAKTFHLSLPRQATPRRIPKRIPTRPYLSLSLLLADSRACHLASSGDALQDLSIGSPYNELEAIDLLTIVLRVPHPILLFKAGSKLGDMKTI